MTHIVADSSALISLSGTCNLGLLEFFSKGGRKFVIPPTVAEEIVTRPMGIPRFAYSALRLGRLVKEGLLGVVTHPDLDTRTLQVLDAANRLFSVDGKPLVILQKGEAECMALISLEPKVYDGFLVDEKTARLVLESPGKLADALKGEYEGHVEVHRDAHEKLQFLFAYYPPIFRSAELAVLGGQKGYYTPFGTLAQAAMHASIHALRTAGCSISETEMAEYDAMKL